MTGTIPSTGFFGRHGELATFERGVDGARVGRPAVILVGGEPGIGKSTLLMEAARRSGAELVVGRCLPMGGEVIPLAPLAEVLRTVRRMAPETLDAAPALASPSAWLDGASTATEVPAARLFESVLEVVGRLSGGGVVMVAFEDLHWADARTWDLFDFRSRQPLLHRRARRRSPQR